MENMNREIKFEMWDTENKEWRNPRQTRIGDMNNNYAGLGNRFVFLQYTGLKDKNGVEIYEGDILHGREEGDGETTAWTDVYYIVFFKNGSFRIREKHIKEDSEWCDYLDDDNILNYYKVIGNIFEENKTQKHQTPLTNI